MATNHQMDGRQRLSKMLQIHGYSACRETLILLDDHYTSSRGYESMEDFITKLNSIITFETEADSSIIDPDLAYLVIQKLCKIKAEDDQATGGTPAIINKKNVEVKNVQCNQTIQIIVEPVNEFNIHYNFLHKKLSALPIFQGEFQLTSVYSLTASSQASTRCICFGMLTRDLSKIDGYTLIDSSGRVPLRMTADTTYRNNLVYLNCIVLIEGVYINQDDILYAAKIGYPPVLLDPIRNKTLSFGDDQLVIMLHEIFLDDEDVCQALATLFSGYNSMDEPPAIFILIGNFTREPCPDRIKFKDYMKKLIKIWRECGNLSKSHMILIPGSHDCSSLPLPKPPLTRDQFPLNLAKMIKFKNVHLATNPVDIYFGDSKFTVISHSYFKELNKNILHDMTDRHEELFETVKQLMLSNAHLSASTSKSYSSSLKLWHKPDLLILADPEAFGRKYEYCSSKSDDTSFATMPSFSRQYFQFRVYYPRTGEIEDSQVNTEEFEEEEDIETK